MKITAKDIETTRRVLTSVEFRTEFGEKREDSMQALQFLLENIFRRVDGHCAYALSATNPELMEERLSELRIDFQMARDKAIDSIVQGTETIFKKDINDALDEVQRSLQFQEI